MGVPTGSRQQNGPGDRPRPPHLHQRGSGRAQVQLYPVDAAQSGGESQGIGIRRVVTTPPPTWFAYSPGRQLKAHKTYRLIIGWSVGRSRDVVLQQGGHHLGNGVIPDTREPARPSDGSRSSRLSTGRSSHEIGPLACRIVTGRGTSCVSGNSHDTPDAAARRLR